jgi:hypothetical protein
LLSGNGGRLAVRPRPIGSAGQHNLHANANAANSNASPAGLRRGREDPPSNSKQQQLAAMRREAKDAKPSGRRSAGSNGRCVTVTACISVSCNSNLLQCLVRHNGIKVLSILIARSSISQIGFLISATATLHVRALLISLVSQPIYPFAVPLISPLLLP